MDSLSSLGNIDPQTLDELYREYQQNPNSVDESWQKFFKGFDFALAHYSTNGGELYDTEVKVLNLIDAYRKRGHLFTQTNPVRTRRKYSPTLDIENFGLNQSELETTFQAGKEIGIGPAKLNDIIDHLKETYCKSIGVEYLYIRDNEVVSWIKEKIESSKNQTQFTPEQKKHIFFSLEAGRGFRTVYS